MQIKEPTCSDGTYVYCCFRNGITISNWRLELTESFVTVICSRDAAVTTVNSGNAVVALNCETVTEATSNVTATMLF